MGFGSHDPPPPQMAQYNNAPPPHTAYAASLTTTPVQLPPIADSSPIMPPAAAAAAVAPSAAVAPAVAAPEAAPQQSTNSLGVFTVISTYTPTLSDEIDIQPGDRVEILIQYDDGWCQGINLSRGNVKGVFPRHCVSEQSETATKRVSSMYTQQQQPPQQQAP